jgi:membrane protein DedA with SNARE-associated domain
MDLWVNFWSGLTSFITAHGLLAVAVIVLLKSAGVPLPVPADLLVVMVGAQASAAQAPIWPAWLLLSASTTIGAGILYAFARWVGEEDIVHYGHYIGLTPYRLDAARTQLETGGRRAILAARVVPGLRLAIVVVCGVLNIPERQVFPAVAGGALIYVGACLLGGYLLNQRAVALAGQLVFSLGLFESVVGVGILLFWLVRARRRLRRPIAPPRLRRASQIRAGALAGALAVFGATMTLNVILYLAGPILGALLPGENTVETLIVSSGGLLVVVESVLGVVFLGVIWGSMYAIVDPRWAVDWPDWLRGLAFGVFPLGVALLPALLGALASDQSFLTCVLQALGEVICWTTYGVLVGLCYPIFRARRVPATESARSHPANLAVKPPVG